MRRTDHIFVYYDPIDNKRHCRICSAATGSIGTVCYVCVQEDSEYKCCSHSNNGRWTEYFKFDNTIHKILVSTNGCNLIPNCNKECKFRNTLKDLYKQMTNVDER